MTGRVAAGAIAEKVLRESYGIEIVAFTSSIGNEFLVPPTAQHPHPTTNPEFLSLLDKVTREDVDAQLPVRCPNEAANARMTKVIEKFRDLKDSIGGTVTCVVRNVPTGLGEPCFDKMEAVLAHAMMSIPATKAFSIGSGFAGCQMPGSLHNDPFVRAPASSTDSSDRIKLITKTNNSGGIQGGISNGAHIYFDVGFKPPATIGQAQTTAGYNTEEGVLEAKGRHDPCVVPRAIPIVEAMAAIAILDAMLSQQARVGARSRLPALERTIPVERTQMEKGTNEANGIANGA